MTSTKNSKKHQLILQADSEDERAKPPPKTPTSSEEEEGSLRSSDQSSDSDSDDPMKLSKRISIAKKSVRFSVMDVGLLEAPLGRSLAHKMSVVPHKQSQVDFNVVVKVKGSGAVRECFSESFEISKKILPRNSAILILFKKKA